MRLLLFADLHLDAPFSWAPPAPAARRRQNLRDTLLRILTLAEEVGADAILCAGDLYEHDRLSPDSRRFLERSFADAGRRVLLAPGNHDWYGPKSLYSQVRWPDHVHVFTEDRLTPFELSEGLTIWGAAFHGPVRPEGFFADGFAVDRGGLHLGLFHGSERAAFQFEGRGKDRHAPFDAGEVEQAGLAHALVGHYHLPKNDARITYPGNPDPLSFGETGDRGAVVVDLAPDGRLEFAVHRVGVSELHDLQLDLTGACSTQDVRERARELLEGLSGSVRLTLAGELAPEIQLGPETLTDVADGLDALVLRTGELHESYDLASIEQEATVRGQFVRDVMESDLDERMKRRVLVTGLRALDGRDDLEVA